MKIMKELCLRIELERTTFIPDEFRNRLILLACDACHKIDLKQKLDKYTKLLIIPIMCAKKKTENKLPRIFDAVILENLAEEFGDADEEALVMFFRNLKKAALKEIKYSHEWLRNISKGTYCKIAARLFEAGKKEILYMIAIQYNSLHSRISASGVRSNWYFDEELFFQIGIALDEGITEDTTIQIMNYGKETGVIEGSKDEGDFYQDAYLFEMKFYNKLLSIFNIDRKEFIGNMFMGKGCLDFLIDATRKVDYCDYYKLLKLSDQQKWKEVNIILKKYIRIDENE